MDANNSVVPLGSISSFTLHHRAGYAAYVRAIYCVPSLLDDGATMEIRETERLGPAINLGRDENRTLKGLDIPSGAEVQLVLELVAAGNPRVMASESWRFLPGSFRTATYVCRGTVFNPHLEMDFPKRPTLDDKRPAYDEKTMLIAPQPATVEPRPPVSPRCSFLCCL